MIVALCSGKGSPGVSTLACLVGAVWPERGVVVAECDPSGNDLAARFGLSPRIGMASLVLARRRGLSEEPLGAHVQNLPGGLDVLVGPVGPEAAITLDGELAHLGSAVFPPDIDVLVDCGSVRTGTAGQRALLEAADHVVVVARLDPAGVVHARRMIDLVCSLSPRPPCSLAGVGSSPFADFEIESVLDVDGHERIPSDPIAAAMVCGVPGRSRTLARSELVAAARRLAARFEGRSAEPVRGGVEATDRAPDRRGDSHGRLLALARAGATATPTEPRHTARP